MSPEPDWEKDLTGANDVDDERQQEVVSKTNGERATLEEIRSNCNAEESFECENPQRY